MDQGTEGVTDAAGVVEEVLPGPVAAPRDELRCRVAQRLPDLRDGDLPQRRRAGGVPGEITQHLPHGGLGGRPEGHLLRPDEPSEQLQPAGEHDCCSPGGLLTSQVLPVPTERSEVEGVDPGWQAGADGVRGHAECPARAFVLVLDVAQDESPVAVGHEPQRDRLHGTGLPTPGSAEDHHVGVGDAGRVVQGPADRVAVERSPGQPVDPDQRACRRQSLCRDQRPDTADLLGRHPERRQRCRNCGPAGCRVPGTSGPDDSSVPAAVQVRWLVGWLLADRVRRLVAEVGQ